VISAVNFARNNGPSVSVRAGGQNVSGNAVCDGGLMIDRSRVRHPLGLPRNDRGGRGLTGPWNLSSEPTLG
jgi:FAD/FMN-containing dehydrogenase